MIAANFESISKKYKANSQRQPSESYPWRRNSTRVLKVETSRPTSRRMTTRRTSNSTATMRRKMTLLHLPLHQRLGLPIPFPKARSRKQGLSSMNGLNQGIPETASDFCEVRNRNSISLLHIIILYIARKQF